jgi:hypothetical protein
MQAAVTADFGADGVQQVQEARVDGMDFVGAMIPQNPVDRRDGALIVLTVAAVADLQAFAGMGVEKFKDALAPLVGERNGVKGSGKYESGGQEGAELEKLSAGNLGVVCRLWWRRLSSDRFTHTSHPIARSFQVNGRLPIPAELRSLPTVPGVMLISANPMPGFRLLGQTTMNFKNLKKSVYYITL